MYSFPSASIRRAPSARSMTSGSPPTARNARTGLFTPPTSTCCAWRKIARERSRTRLGGPCVIAFPCPCPDSLFRRALARLQPARGVLGVVGEDNVRAGAPDGREDFQHDALLVQPAVARSGLHHGIFPADV